jgi:hypothetical protein
MQRAKHGRRVARLRGMHRDAMGTMASRRVGNGAIRINCGKNLPHAPATGVVDHASRNPSKRDEPRTQPRLVAAREPRTLCTRDLTRKPRSSDWAEALIAVPHVVHHKVRRRDARCCSRRTAFPTSRTSLSFDAQLPTAARRQPDVVSNPDVVMRTTP